MQPLYSELAGLLRPLCTSAFTSCQHTPDMDFAGSSEVLTTFLAEVVRTLGLSSVLVAFEPDCKLLRIHSIQCAAIKQLCFA